MAEWYPDLRRCLGIEVKTWGMEFFCNHRDRYGSVALRDELLEAHWSHMDRNAAEMIARGPTLADDVDTAMGSVHIVDLPDSAAAGRTPSTNPTTTPVCTGTCCCTGGAIRWDALRPR